MNLFLDAEGWSVENEDVLLSWLEKEAVREKLKMDVDLVLVTDEVISRLNEDYLDHEGATDVIAFNLKDTIDDDFVLPDEDMPEGFDFGVPSGEIYVSLETAMKQSVKYKVSLTNEVTRLALHGLLHLAGWSDKTEAERKKMSTREDEGLKRASEKTGSFNWVIKDPAN